jgi:hypothetical protein
MEPIEDVAVELPSDQVVGSHADAASVWHTRESFIIDFLAMRRPPEARVDDNEQLHVTQDFVVSSRIRIPPTHVIELMKALEVELSKWETETGRRPPTQSPHPDVR